MANASPTDLISNWSTLIENLESSPLGFFESVEAGIQKRAIPEVAISRVDYRESGIISAKREYLRVTRDKLIFDICAAPYGTGFFVSWWLGKPTGGHPLVIVGILLSYLLLTGFVMNVLGVLIGLPFSIFILPIILMAVVSFLAGEGKMSDEYVLAIPGIGYLYKRFFRPATYYAFDTATMFQNATHAAVLEAVDSLMTARGLRVLSEAERRPTLRESLGR